MCASATPSTFRRWRRCEEKWHIVSHRHRVTKSRLLSGIRYGSQLQRRAIKLEVTPESRLQDVTTQFPDYNLAAPPVGPCGGFSRSYLAYTESTDIPSKGELIWYVSA